MRGSCLQDDAPAHKSRAVTSFLCNKGVQALSWPASSPDLNPIENPWALLKKEDSGAQSAVRRVSLGDGPRGVGEARQSKALLQSLFGSMPNRLQTVLARDGAATGY